MITEKARIIAIDKKYAWLESHRYSACDTCNVKTGCGQNLINNMSGGKRNLIKLPIDDVLITKQVDDVVEVSIEETSLLWGSLLLYIFPLFMMIIGALFAGSIQSSNTSELANIIGAAIGLSIAFGMIRWYSAIMMKRQSYQPLTSHINKKNH